MIYRLFFITLFMVIPLFAQSQKGYYRYPTIRVPDRTTFQLKSLVVDNMPNATFKGEDAQLDAAIDHLLRKINEAPVKVPPHPPYPDKSFDYNQH